MSKWKEIRCDYIDESINVWMVDAWETDDDSEEGRVIAYIDALNPSRVIYVDPLARVDEYAQEVIQLAIKEIIDRKTEQEGVVVYRAIVAALKENHDNGDYAIFPGVDDIVECNHEYDAHVIADLLTACGYMDVGVEYNEETMLYEVY